MMIVFFLLYWIKWILCVRSVVVKLVSLELKGYTREQVCWLMNAVDVALMTSFSEGSPQFIKEAMACGCPIVSVDVGDVSEVIGGIEGCYIVERNGDEIALFLNKALNIGVRTNGRDRIIERGFDNKQVVANLMKIYDLVL